MMKAAIVGAVLSVAVALPTDAWASAPVDQYVEEVPGAGGSKPPKSGPGPSAAPAGGLSDHGAEGEAAAATLERTEVGPTRAKRKPKDESAKGRSSQREAGGQALARSPEASGLSGALAALFGDGRGGMGLALPALLALSLAAMAVARRRRGAVEGRRGGEPGS